MNVLEQTRKAFKLTRSQMQQRLNIGKSYYSMLSRGVRPMPKSVAIRLEDEFGVPLSVSLRPEVHGEETDNQAATVDPLDVAG